MTAKLERMRTPYVRKCVFITSLQSLFFARALGIIRDPSLVSALEQGLRRGRRFVLRPGPKDW